MADLGNKRRLRSATGEGLLRRLVPTPGVPIYEELLDRDPRWALNEGSRHFDEKSMVFKALHEIAAQLEMLEIPYAAVGGMALFRHGLRHFTEDVDLLVTKGDLRAARSNPI